MSRLKVNLDDDALAVNPKIENDFRRAFTATANGISADDLLYSEKGVGTFFGQLSKEDRLAIKGQISSPIIGSPACSVTPAP